MTTRRGFLLGSAATVILGRLPAPALALEEVSPPVVEILPPPAMDRITVTLRGLDHFGRSILETVTLEKPAGSYGQAKFPGFKRITAIEAADHA